MPLLYLGLGSNQGVRSRMLAEARAHCHRQLGPIQGISPIYTTAAWGLTKQPDFLNQVISVATLLEPHRCLEIVLAAEQLMGRQRTQKWGPRLIDIDLLLFGEQFINTPKLSLPHPFIQDRLFVLLPLADIAPAHGQILHNKTPKELLANCPDTSVVELWNPRIHAH